ncbi:hypothetical protein EV368DRAFT_80382 [Lentinula lateritia]|uniref:Uncharacterized protein n=1 Tax=Lentinula aff. lateritia TaxID=2804960 RepID=A0ACC1U5U7_9AGAR|nr:hypothetical protein F5876DRAFT_74923 [Lentinula aff. lateritia]KAJ3854651.1 hypothetical protein EV368DRAFT_80382 [Lentinula lateritia]
MHAIVPSSSSSFIHPTYWPQASNSALNGAPPLRLKSPFQLASSSTVKTTSESLCSRAHQRRRHCVRVDCPVQSVSSSSSSHPFDDISWISAMDSSSEDYGLADIADLSELPITTSVVEEASSGAGPVRRRKTSLHRTSPLRVASGSSTHSTHHPSILRDRHVLAPSTPRPRPRLPRSRIAFHNLMPLFTCDLHKYRSSNPSSPAH